uniref:AlNc14C24G2392 protein n=1 Tax=Albugo laibachii Nc14 TaxID=890382 RepID=F0W692_9STRA|nr:AlNc14C24G2392 [Albugo laibachii Nc14]|eukprot:CCA16635.1 AlNc14C24G2392 [Albugo laibachii Nc14]
MQRRAHGCAIRKTLQVIQKKVSTKSDNQSDDGSINIGETMSKEISTKNFNQFVKPWRSCPGISNTKKTSLMTHLEKIHSQVHCLRTDSAIFQTRSCWACLATLSKGIVSLHKSHVTKSTDDKQSYLIRLFTNVPISTFIFENAVNCNIPCGEIHSGEDDCTSTAVHVDNFLPPNDISLSIRGELLAKMKTDTTDQFGGCILTRHIPKKSGRCRSCVPKL